jgi:hypothetical protein
LAAFATVVCEREARLPAVEAVAVETLVVDAVIELTVTIIDVTRLKRRTALGALDGLSARHAFAFGLSALAPRSSCTRESG